MPTEIQLNWLDDLVQGHITKRSDPHKYSVYVKRIRERIDAEMESWLWIAENCPEFLKDEEWEITELGQIKHRRLKNLLMIIKKINPDVDPVLVRLKKDVDIF